MAYFLISFPSSYVGNINKRLQYDTETKMVPI